LLAGACATGIAKHLGAGGRASSDSSVMIGLLGFALALAGLVLLAQGKRVSLACRAELRRHRTDRWPVLLGSRRRAGGGNRATRDRA
jgi:hypothetical protein